MSEIVTLRCPTCGAKARMIDGTNRLHCDYCGNEHLVQMSFEPAAPPATVKGATMDVDSAPLRPRVPVPAAVQVLKDGQSARIVQRWFSLKYVPMAFFAIAWDAFLIFWYSMALGTGAPWIFIVFPIAHLAVGIGITYSTLAGFVNRTVIELTPQELAVWFEPLPWLGEKAIRVDEIQQLYCKETRQSTKHGYTYRYQLHVVTRDMRDLKLVSNLESPEIAKFFEQQIETWLRIPDRRVEGEMERD